jgi:two-component system sensor histidine kinase HydH
LGALLILVPIFVFWTMENLHRQKESTMRLLVEKGAALIRSFEAGARTGMMGMMGMQGADFRLQRLLMEMAQLPDIVHLIVTDADGVVLAHNDPTQIGDRYGTGLDLKGQLQSPDLSWRQISGPNGPSTFEVFRQFRPLQGPRRGMHGRMMHNGRRHPPMAPDRRLDDRPKIIFVGLNTAAIEAARQQDARHIMIMGGILLLIGFAGVVFLFLAQAYRETRTSLSRVRAFSDNLVAHMPMGLVATDADRKVAFFNQTAGSILRISPKQALGKSPEMILPPPLVRVLEGLRPGNDILEQEIQCPVSRNQTVPLEVIATALTEEGNGFLGHVLLFRDLTQIQELKREVLRSQRLASVGRLAAGVAHELRNPLSSIKGFATYFKDRYRDIPQDQETATIMIQEVERLNRVIGQLLEFARPVTIDPKPTSLSSLIRHTLRLVEQDAQQKSIQVHQHVSSDVGDLAIDPDRFKQVLLNLYLNALESMETGGILSVTAERMRDTDSVQVTVSDTGKGIDPDHLAHVFDPYFTTKASGTGLGLAIAHKVVESHGGQISVRSERGQGTTVVISLRIQKEI